MVHSVDHVCFFMVSDLRLRHIHKRYETTQLVPSRACSKADSEFNEQRRSQQAKWNPFHQWIAQHLAIPILVHWGIWTWVSIIFKALPTLRSVFTITAEIGLRLREQQVPHGRCAQNTDASRNWFSTLSRRMQLAVVGGAASFTLAEQAAFAHGVDASMSDLPVVLGGCAFALGMVRLHPDRKW